MNGTPCLRPPRAFVVAAPMLLAITAHVMTPAVARACGCFSPPDPNVPIVQAGERIVFYRSQGKVTAHVQIQYSGPANEFGWLLPMPSVPTMTLGSEDLFTQIIQTTQPSYTTISEFVGDCFGDDASSSDGSTGGDSDGFPPGAPGSEGDSPLVYRESVGPFDTVVLRADAKEPMLDWLNGNGFYVPPGTDAVVAPYIGAGKFFLALRLLKGEDAGDIQPVVVEYDSDTPMIPIILTSVAADPDMGVQVWVLGDSRAIPSNYRHTSINDAAVDWLNFGVNYADVVTDAVDEAQGHHSFVTEYAGPSDVMLDVLDGPNRFGRIEDLAQITDPVQFLAYLRNNGYTYFDSRTFNDFYSPQLIAVLRGHLPIPTGLADFGVSESEYYVNFDYYINDFRLQNPDLFADLDLDYVAADLAAAISERYVEPTLTAGKMFRDFPYLTRMFTTLSPTEMTKDPCFSFNGDLPPVGKDHQGTLTYFCDGSGAPLSTVPTRLTTEQGFEVWYPDGTGGAGNQTPVSSIAGMPQSHYIDILRETSEAREVDNTALIRSLLRDENRDRCGGIPCDALASPDSGGCGCAASGEQAPTALFALAFVVFAVRRRRH